MLLKKLGTTVPLHGGIPELGSKFIFFYAEVKQGVPALGEDRLGSSGVGKGGEESLHQLEQLITSG